MPAMRKSMIDINRLLQDYMTVAGIYDLTVFEFTEEQVENFLIKKLQGY
jgi:hypothetical protein